MGDQFSLNTPKGPVYPTRQYIHIPPKPPKMKMSDTNTLLPDPDQVRRELALSGLSLREFPGEPEHDGYPFMEWDGLTRVEKVKLMEDRCRWIAHRYSLPSTAILPFNDIVNLCDDRHGSSDADAFRRLYKRIIVNLTRHEMSSRVQSPGSEPKE